MKRHIVILAGFVIAIATGLGLAVCAVGAPRTTVGRPVDDSHAEPMGGVILGCYCLGQDVWCRGANGQAFKVAHCPGTCLNATCQ